MSSPLAIATVTAILKDLLSDGLINSNVSTPLGGAFKVTASPPDRIAVSGQEPNQLNLFLYRVTPNQGWRNEGLPSRTSAGDQRMDNPPLAIDLHYLLTAYGADDLNAEILLGYAMQLLHETPGLTRQAIRRAFNPHALVSDKLLPSEIEDRNPADLADQVELIKICPEYLNTEDLSKLWTAMQARYRPSMGYQVSVVLIQRTKPTRAPLLVREPRVFVGAFSHPVIERVEPPIATNDKLLMLHGQSLHAHTTKVRVGSELLTPQPIDLQAPQAVRVTIPASLRAGVSTVQIVQEIPLGLEPHPGAGYESNIAAFVLAPRFTEPPQTTAFCGGAMIVKVSPTVRIDQQVALLIGNLAISLPPRPLDVPAQIAELEFIIPEDLLPGAYLVRVMVDGASSLLAVDETKGSPTYGQYIGPKVTIE